MTTRLGPIIRTGLAVFACACALAAQTPASVRLVPTYTPNSWLLYSVDIHTTISSQGGLQAGFQTVLETRAEIQMHILPGAQPNDFESELRFTRYSTTITSASANDAQRAGLEKQITAQDHAATSMPPARFRVQDGKFSVLFRQPGGAYDQAVDMLSEMARTDDLPTGPVAVGAQWTRARSRSIPNTTVSMPLQLNCQLTALGAVHGQPAATIVVHSTASANLPPGSLPGTQQLAAQGLVPFGRFSATTVATSQFRRADAVMLSTRSETHTQLHIEFVGPSPKAAASDSNIVSSGTVTLEKILAAPPAAGGSRSAPAPYFGSLSHDTLVTLPGSWQSLSTRPVSSATLNTSDTNRSGARGLRANIARSGDDNQTTPLP